MDNTDVMTVAETDGGSSGVCVCVCVCWGAPSARDEGVISEICWMERQPGPHIIASDLHGCDDPVRNAAAMANLSQSICQKCQITQITTYYTQIKEYPKTQKKKKKPWTKLIQKLTQRVKPVIFHLKT